MTDITLTWRKNGTQQVEHVSCEATESAIMRSAAEFIERADCPSTISVDAGRYGDVCLNVAKRGTFKKGGVTYPSRHVTVNGSLSLPSSDYEEAYLTCINPESNNYKFYHIKPDNTVNVLRVTYGRIGSQRGEAFGVKDVQTPYGSKYYWTLYYEKLSKGYVDQSDVYLAGAKAKASPTAKTSATVPVPKGLEASCELYDKLTALARNVVKKALADDSAITEKMAKESRRVWKELKERKTIKGFNKKVMELAQIAPRKCRYVTDLMAQSTADFQRIIDREDDIISSMEVIVGSRPASSLASTAQAHRASYADLGIEVYYANAEQEKKVMEMLSPQLRPKVKRIYRVIPKAQKERFNKYLKDNHIRCVKELFHGTKNVNLHSIMQNSLLLDSGAAYTGSMLGKALYLAPNSLKSWNYTSARGTTWAHGTSDVGYMCIFAAAYGKPYIADTDAKIRKYTKSELAAKGCNCVHAKGGVTWLRADEVAMFDQDGVLLNYVVEFAA